MQRRNSFNVHCIISSWSQNRELHRMTHDNEQTDLCASYVSHTMLQQK